MTGVQEFDVIVLGAGNAGLAAAGVARAAGRRVLVVEAAEVGGVCPLRGCVPKGVMVAAAEAFDTISRAGTHRIRVGPPELDWAGLVERTRTFVDGVASRLEQDLVGRGIELVRGRARLTGPSEVAVGSRRYLAEKLVVATGSTPRPLPIPGARGLITSTEVLELATLPECITFVGAGVVAFELAHVLARAGAHVTLLEVSERPLPGVDADAAAVLVRATLDLGVQIETSVTLDRIDEHHSGFDVHYRKGRSKASVRGTVVVNGAGRVPDLGGLDLDAAGIRLDQGRVSVDEYLRSTENPNVLFAGDAIPGRPQRSPLATHEGRVAGHNAVHEDLQAVEYGFQPAAVFTIPALATVGRLESDARREGLEFDVRTNDMREWRSARSRGERFAWAKVLVERRTDRILGAHLVGHGAAETIHTFAMAIEMGIPARDIASRVYAYPTFHADLRFLV